MTINIENVWQRTTPGLRAEITAFWETNKMLPEGVVAAERATQVVLIARSPAGAIAGLTTADVVQFKQLNSNYFYLFRAAILREFRIPGLIAKMMVETRDFLEEFSELQQNGCIGMLTFVENPSLLEHRNEAVWPASKMVYIGSDAKGRHIRVYYFKGARI